MKQTEELAAVLELIQQYQKELQQNQQQQQQTDYDINREDGGNPPAPEIYSNPPIPTTLQTKFFRSQEAPTREENKRANRKYIKTLSHFSHHDCHRPYKVKIHSRGHKRSHM